MIEKKGIGLLGRIGDRRFVFLSIVFPFCTRKEHCRDFDDSIAAIDISCYLLRSIRLYQSSSHSHSLLVITETLLRDHNLKGSCTHSQLAYHPRSIHSKQH